jgi:uncharacterized protein YeaO (DUF488 family)
MAYVKDKRWNDPIDPDDGLRVLICRIRPRGVAKANETWHRWERALAPSLALLKAFQTKRIDWREYERRYLSEMQSEQTARALDDLAQCVQRGRPVTLLCSSACTDRTRCHRSLAHALLLKRLA